MIIMPNQLDKPLIIAPCSTSV